MIKKLLYPDFVPKPFKIIRQDVSNKFKESKALGIKVFITHIARYYFPRTIGFLITPFSIFLRKSMFLRLDLDHFGPILYPFYFLNSKLYSKEKKYYILEFNSRNSYLVNSFPSNFYFVKSPIMWLLLGGFFFTKTKSLHIFPVYYNQEVDYSIRKKTDWEPLSRITSDLIPLSNNTEQERPKWLLNLVGNHDYVVLFNRESGCDYTAGNSARNIGLDKFIPFLESNKSSNFKVIRYGGKYMTPANNYNISENLLIDYATSVYCSPENDIDLWKNCTAVIGSPSGATHIPSVFYGKPTMYIGYNRIKTLIAFFGLDTNIGTLPSNTTTLLPSLLVENKKVSIKERFYNEFIKNYIYSHSDIVDFDDDLLKDSINYFLDKLFDIEASAPNITQHSITSSGSYDGIEIKIQEHGNLWIPNE
jgi:putative glycosyltransferase (TIGR04372 family)